MSRKLLYFLLILFSLTLFLFGACREKTSDGNDIPSEKVTLVFYGLYDEEAVYAPYIEAFEQSYNNQVDIIYKKFNDPEAYLDLIINELAEGEGPDIFMLNNTWISQHYKKLTPAPTDQITPSVFRDTFVEVTSKDLIFPNEEGVEQVWGLSLYVDTLALIYNKDHFEDAIPSQGKPGVTWAEIIEEVQLLNRADNSFEAFERAGIALGRGDNLLFAFDILMLLFLQSEVQFYDASYQEVLFGTDPAALAALDLYTSFGLPSQENYSWNYYLADSDSNQKEIVTFARGKVSMILGYPETYEEILTEIQVQKNNDEDVISPADIYVQEVPQMFDPETSSETRIAYAEYYALVVSRNSQHADLAWEFILFMAEEENMRLYFEATNHPTSRRSLIEEQMADPIYGPFVAQVGYAQSLPMANANLYEEIFLEGISEVIDTEPSERVIKEMAEEIQSLIPAQGVKPTVLEEE